MKSRMIEMQLGVLVLFALLMNLAFVAGCSDSPDDPQGDDDVDFIDGDQSGPDCVSDWECNVRNAGDICCLGICMAPDDCEGCSADDECKFDEDCSVGERCNDSCECEVITPDCTYDTDCSGTPGTICCDSSCVTPANCSKCTDSSVCIADDDCMSGQYCNDNCECGDIPKVPLITLEPAEIDFGFINFGEKRVESLFIHNDGGVDLNIFLMYFTDTSEDFKWTYEDEPDNHNSPTAAGTITIPAGETREFLVMLESTKNGRYEGFIDIDCNDTSKNGGKYRVNMFSREKGETTLEVIPTALYHDFGDVEVDTNTPAQFKVTISNKYVEGNKVLSVGPLQWEPAQSSDFSVDPDYDMASINMLKFGESVSFFVRCHPREEGSKTISLVINHDADYSPNNVSPEKIIFACSGVLPKLEVEPDVGDENKSFDFGNVTVGYTKSQKFTLKSARAGVVKMESIEWANPDLAGDFEIVDTEGAATAEIDPLSSGVSFRINYTPSNIGGDVAILYLKSNSNGENTMQITIMGNGVTSQPLCKPLDLAFGPVLLNTTEALTFTCENQGTGDLDIYSMELEGTTSAFELSVLSQQLLPITLREGDAPQEFTVLYRPTDTTPGVIDEDILTIKTNHSEIPNYKVNLSGRPVWPSCKFSVDEDLNFTDTVDFGEVNLDSSKTLHLRIDNYDGGYDCIVSDIVRGPNTSTYYSFLPELLPAIAPGGSKTISIMYSPRDYPGWAQGSLIFHTNNLVNETVEVKLNGFAVDPKIFIEPLSTQSAPFQFLDTLANDCSDLETFSIRNIGKGTLQIYLPYELIEGIEGSFLVGEWTETFLGEGKLRPYDDTGDEITFTVQFCPQGITERPIKGEIRIDSNDIRTPNKKIYLLGEAKACPTGWYDLDADPSDCEYFCNVPPGFEFPIEKCENVMIPDPENSGQQILSGYDNDCNGEINEGFGIGEVCMGLGECGPGTRECDPNNVFGTVCSTSFGGSDYDSVAADEICDGKDNDCDGETDEGFVIGYPCISEGECGIGVIECDTEHTTRCSADIGGSEYPDPPPAELCNGKDDDCDGETDNGIFFISNLDDVVNCDDCIGNYCGGVGECGGGFYECDNTKPDGLWIRCCSDPGGSCQDTSVEYCDGKDNDCDGQTDNGFDIGTTCNGIGECGLGVKQCDPENNLDTTCSTDIGGDDYDGTPETCNGLDDDCDGQTDEDFNIGVPCEGVGECGLGEYECNPLYGTDASQPLVICSTDPLGSEHQDVTETCDGKDNDCDGETDNGIAVEGQPQVGWPCDGVGECGIGVVECKGFYDVRCSTDIGGTIHQDRNETCDGRDNDCDGQTDEDFSIGLVCEGEGECGAGTFICADIEHNMCSSEVPGSPDVKDEICDGKDNDCDGETDEDFLVGQLCEGVGECSDGVWECADEDSRRCSTNIGGSQYDGSTELCDNKDNDCDGFIDNDINFCSEDGTDAIDHCGGCNNVCTVEHGTPTCANDGNDLCYCAIESCYDNWHDTNSVYTDGCECQSDTNDLDGSSLGDTCGNAISMGVLTDNLALSEHKATMSGNLAELDDEDWYTFTAKDLLLGTEDEFHVTIELTDNPTGEVVLDIMTGGCSAASTTVCSHTQDYKHAEDGQWAPGSGDSIWGKGHKPCGDEAATPDDRNYCDEKDITYFVRVYRSLGAADVASCGEYTLVVTNAFYSTSK